MKIINQQSLFRVVAASIMALLLAGIVGCNGLLNQNPLNLGSDTGKQPSGAVFCF